LTCPQNGDDSAALAAGVDDVISVGYCSDIIKVSL
jgi:hypothetical protein